MHADARRTSLILAATADVLIACLHVVIAAVGPPAYRYFGAIGLANDAARGSATAAVLTIGVAIVFIVWGCYALSAARVFGRLPLLRLALAAISLLMILRGLVVIPDLVRLFTGAGYPFRQTVISAVALLVGLLHVPGVFNARKEAAS